MDLPLDPMVDEDRIDISGTLIDQVMDILHSGSTFTVNGILRNVLMATSDIDVFDCLTDLEAQGLAEVVGDNPLQWQLAGISRSPNNEMRNTENFEPCHQPMDCDDPEREPMSSCGNEYVRDEYMGAPQGASLRYVESLSPPKSQDYQFKKPQPPRQQGSKHSKDAKGCPPPPSAALFQSLISQSKHPSKPVSFSGGTSAYNRRPAAPLTINRRVNSGQYIKPSAPYSPDGSPPTLKPPNDSRGMVTNPAATDHVSKTAEQTNRGVYSSHSESQYSGSYRYSPGSSTGTSLQTPQASNVTPLSQVGFSRQMNTSNDRTADKFSWDIPNKSQGFESQFPHQSIPRFPHQTESVVGKSNNFPPRQTSFSSGQTSFSSSPTGFQPTQSSLGHRQSGFTAGQNRPSSSQFPQPPTAEMFKSLASKGPQKISSNSRGAEPGASKTERPNLTPNQIKVLEFMKEHGRSCNTLQLAHACGLKTKKDINPSLYQMQSLGLIIKMHDQPPTWKLRSDNRERITSITSGTNSSSVNFTSREQGSFRPQFPGTAFNRAENKSDHGSRPLHSFGKRDVAEDESPALKMPHYTGQSHFNKGFSQNKAAGFTQQSYGSGLVNQENQTQALSRIVHSSINQNPVSALNEYAQKNRLELTYETLNERRGIFAVSVVLGGKVFPPGRASNSKDARREACDVALRSLLGQNQGQNKELNICPPSADSLRGARTHFDLMAALSQHAFVQVAASIEENIAGRKVVACFVMKLGPDDTGRVVSLGSGNRCVTGERLSMEGKVVNDSHAEIVARRSLHRFLYDQIRSFYDGQDSIFEHGKISQLLALKEGISFHLYISTAPCGDGALFTPRMDNELTQPQSEGMEHAPEFTSKVQGILRTKIEDGEGTIPIDPNDGPQTWDGLLRGQRLRTMSCSDKICRWDVVGLQGALLTHFIEPIYLGSLTLGYLYDHGHLSRAVCCRLQHKNDLGAKLSSPFRLQHPLLGRVTAYEASRHTEKTNNLSLNWTIGDTHAEVIDGRTGACLSRTKNIPTPARICKASLYGMFRDLCQKTKRSDLLNFETYRDAKNSAKPFQEAKRQMFECFKKSKYGSWVSKPVEQEMFSTCI